MFKPDEERASNSMGTLRKDIRISLVLDTLPHVVVIGPVIYSVYISLKR